MSNTSTFALGLGGGLALWQLLRDQPDGPPGTPQLRNGSTGVCVVELDPTGLTVDGALVDVTEAVRRAHVAGCALVTVAPDAPAATYAALLTALRDANIPAHARTRVAPRNAKLDTKTDFTLITYPGGHKQASTARWFRAEAPIAWSEARDRLIDAGIIDPKLAGRTHAPGGWMLSIDPTQFHPPRAEPLPGKPRNSYISTTFTLVVYSEGVGGPKTTRWFRASSPTTWDAAAERLADAGLIDPKVTLATQPGYWILVGAPGPFNEAKAEPLPKPRRRRNAERASTFTLVEFPDGIWGKKRVRWFRAEPPTTWEDARDRLSAAYVIDRTANTWKLFTDPARFRADRAQPLPIHPRNALELASTFTLVVYPEGVGGPSTQRSFLAEPPATWEDARDRLAVAGLLDLGAIGPGMAGYWKLVTDPSVFDADSAMPLPEGLRPRGAGRSGRYAVDGGRTIVRDGEAIVRIERVDLGDARYVLSPHETDKLTQRIVRLLNRHGAR